MGEYIHMVWHFLGNAKIHEGVYVQAGGVELEEGTRREMLLLLFCCGSFGKRET